MKVISADRLRGAIAPIDLVEPMRDAFIAVSAGRVQTTFGLLDLDDGDVHVKASSAPGDPHYVVKVASWVPSNAARGRPAAAGAILVCSAGTGAPEALLVDEHHLTDSRTAAAGALASHTLAARDARTVAVLGTGVQARLQVTTLAALRPLERVTVWGRRREAAEALARYLDAAVAGSAREAVESADIVITATASREPIVEADWLRPGQHVTALGADDDRKRELAAACFGRADRVVVDSRAQTCATAELAAGPVGADAVAELGEVLAGRAPGRTRDDEITIAKLTGVAAQDLAAARVALERLA
jgi:ornithine cyclodeaminase